MSAGLKEYDVIVAGGGMVGASLACALASLPLRLAVVESVPLSSEDQPSFDLRTTALSRSSQRILDTLGIWSEVSAAATAIRRIHVSEQGRFGTAIIDADEQGIDALGHVLENRRLGAALWRRLEAAGNVDRYCPAQVETVQPAPGVTRVGLRQGDQSHALNARLLVVADGARSRLREALGIGAREEPYGQKAIIGTVEVRQTRAPGTAFERFTAQGPLALLPAGDDRYVFVLTRRENCAGEIMDLNDDAFRNLLQDEFGFRLGRFGRLGRRVAYPLALVCADAVTATRAVLIGNAAHSLHPVAGQGYNLGLRDAAALAETLADDLKGGDGDPGSEAVLRRYREWRERDQHNVVMFTDGLVRLFGQDWPAAGAIRSAALAMFDLLPAAKRGLAHHTMGQAGTVSRLARGLPL